NDLEEMKKADNIILMQDGTILQQMTFPELQRDKYGILETLVDMDEANHSKKPFHVTHSITRSRGKFTLPQSLILQYLYFFGGFLSTSIALGLFALSQSCIILTYMWISLWIHGSLESVPTWTTLVVWSVITVLTAVSIL